MRNQIRDEVEAIPPGDALEQSTKRDVLAWIDSGAPLCRVHKPASPPRHLVSYFVLVDGDHLLLVDHINADLWLPTGGHVEVGEHPRAAVLREAKEELAIDAQFLQPHPLFITNTEVTGRKATHVDVSLWYLLAGERGQALRFDGSEFRAVRWFHTRDVPLERSDPEMARFMRKLAARGGLADSRYAQAGPRRAPETS